MTIDKSKIFDVLVSTDSSSNLDLETKFVYSSYISNERYIDDSIVYDSGLKKRYRYIEILLSDEVSAIRKSDINYKNFWPNELFIKETLTRYHNLNYLSNEINFVFNKLYLNDNKKMYFYNKTSKKENRLESFYSSEENQFNIFNSVQSSSKSAVLRKESESLLKLEKNHDFPSNNEILLLKDYDKIVKDEKEYILNPNEDIEKGNVLGSFNIFKTLTDTVNLGITKCGFLVEKFAKNNKDYEKKSSKFFFKDTSGEEGKQSYSLSLKDQNIKYGETYRYIIQEVFLYREQTKVEGIVNYYLICDYPYITDDIVCKEFKNPNPPVGLTANYNLNTRHLELSWGRPSNDQNDSKGYQILRRESLKEPYTVISQIESHTEKETFERKENILEEVIESYPGTNVTSYIDKDFMPSKIYIYTVRTIDAHGNLSLYSNQIAVLYNFLENDLIIDGISKSGAPINMPNLRIPRKTILFENENFSITNSPMCSNSEEVTLLLTPEFVKLSSNEIDDYLLKENYEFTILKMDSIEKYKENIKIKNFKIIN